ncbi:MAG: hypothetical protein HUK08_06745, partial [Bacteroidaceae bacterium]|nr:hypothetical protein [Bacteroidaceae bacterium]
MANGGIEISISDDAIRAAERFDSIVKQLDNHAKNVGESFKGIDNSIKPFAVALMNIDKNIETISNRLSGFGKAASTGMGAVEAATKGASASASKLDASLENILPVVAELYKKNPFANWTTGRLTESIDLLKEKINGLSNSKGLRNDTYDKKLNKLKTELSQKEQALEYLLATKTDDGGNLVTKMSSWYKKYYADRISDEKRAQSEEERSVRSMAKKLSMASEYEVILARSNRLIANSQKGADTTGVDTALANLKNLIDSGISGKFTGSEQTFMTEFKMLKSQLDVQREKLRQENDIIKAKQKEDEQTLKTLTAEEQAKKKLEERLAILKSMSSEMQKTSSGMSDVEKGMARASVNKATASVNALLKAGVDGNDVSAFNRAVNEETKSIDKQIRELEKLTNARRDAAIQADKNERAQKLAVSSYNNKMVGLTALWESADASNTANGTAKFKDAIDKYTAALIKYESAAKASVVGNDRSAFTEQIRIAFNEVQQYKKELELVAQAEGRVLNGGTSNKKASTSTASQVVSELSNASNNGFSSAVDWAKSLNIAQLESLLGKIKSSLKDDLGATENETKFLITYQDVLKKELASKRQTEEEKTAAQEKAAAERKRIADKEAADNARMEKALKQYSAIMNSDTTAKGILGGGKTSISEMQATIKNLQALRGMLNVSDRNDKERIKEINALITQMKAKIADATGESKKLSQGYKDLLGITNTLTQRFAMMFSISAAQGFIQKLIQVRGELELQKRSLESILQSRSQGDLLFNKTMQSALQSPFKITELITYTKQLAAYRVESGKLFDTTKMLADVSAGLGVEMGRLILAYGQVKAAKFLKGTELRQFTEAGVNMLDELQRYYQEEKGITRTTGEIVQMISDKKVVFEDVEAVFKRLTTEGGMFYKMQE